MVNILHGLLVKVIAYVLRFYRNTISVGRNIENIKGLLSATEIQAAEITLLQILQQRVYATEIQVLSNNERERTALSNKSYLFRLNPFINENGILRVGARLSLADNLWYDQKHLIVMPYLEPFTTIFFRSEHERMLHADPQAMLVTNRLKYWPIKRRGVARKIVHNCMRCFKVKPKILSPIMNDLPKYRIEKPTKCFEVCGIDYAGTIFMKSNHRRNTTQNEAYVCIFICFATKAVRLGFDNGGVFRGTPTVYFKKRYLSSHIFR